MGNIFSETDIRGYVGQSLTTEYLWNVGKAFAEWLPDEGIVVVQSAVDDNTGGALIEGLLLQGRDVLPVVNSGDETALTVTIADNSAAGGVCISFDATQNLAVITLHDQHGVAIVGTSGLGDIVELAEAGNFIPAAEKGQVESL